MSFWKIFDLNWGIDLLLETDNQAESNLDQFRYLDMCDLAKLIPGYTWTISISQCHFNCGFKLYNNKNHGVRVLYCLGI